MKKATHKGHGKPQVFTFHGTDGTMNEQIVAVAKADHNPACLALTTVNGGTCYVMAAKQFFAQV